MFTLGSYIILIIFLGILIGLCFLEAHLARKPARAPGLILPAAGFLFSVFIIVCYLLYSATGMIHTGGTVTVLSDNDKYKVTVFEDGTVDAINAVTGEEIELQDGEGGMYNRADGTLVVTDAQVGEILEGFNSEPVDAGNAGGSVFPVAVPLLALFLNMPTIGFLVIYFITRRGVNSSAQLDKMEIQDI